MGKIYQKKREVLLKKRRARRKKIRKLKEKYLKAKSLSEKKSILEKLRKNQPFIKEEDILSTKN